MFFSWIGRVVAVLMLLLSVFQLIAAFSIAQIESRADRLAAIRRYLGNYESTGPVIDKAIYVIFLAIILGILCEISFTLKKRHDVLSK